MALSDYPLPWRLEYWPMLKNPFLIAANNKPVCQIDAAAGAWMAAQTQERVKLAQVGERESAQNLQALGRAGFRL